MKTDVCNWPQFRKIQRSSGLKLLGALDEFPAAVLVTGCQRSGTTMLARVLSQSTGMASHGSSGDDELKGAIILSGLRKHVPTGRYCFQTTYLDDCYHEYYEHHDYKLVWILRNPFSVVCSLLYNWSRGALRLTFRGGGAADALTGTARWRYRVLGSIGVSRVRQACLVYNAKVLQLFELWPRLGPERMMIVDCNDLVLRKDTVLARIYEFLDLRYETRYGEMITSDSIKKADRLSRSEIKIVKSECEPIYQRASMILRSRAR